ncbi:unnamed protein product [Paramecium primaurelia]|uniref:Uncharacterized protein n=1 Tax=Paramecium primaurelia TaxID=5886 RepID=A0A8S1JS20_PARPR|nr:unnamed protein product [Paramecium primaurelia]
MLYGQKKQIRFCQIRSWFRFFQSLFLSYVKRNSSFDGNFGSVRFRKQQYTYDSNLEVALGMLVTIKGKLNRLEIQDLYNTKQIQLYQAEKIVKHGILETYGFANQRKLRRLQSTLANMTFFAGRLPYYPSQNINELFILYLELHLLQRLRKVFNFINQFQCINK